jgi:hypothetical protein
MKPADFFVNYDGNSLTATIVVRPAIASKILLYALNILFLAIIILFTIGGVGVIVLFIVAFEILFLRYSIWNLYGSETIILKRHTLSYQQSYGFIKLPIKMLPIHKSIRVIPFHEDFRSGSKAMKLIFESHDDANEPVNLYQTALVISQHDYHLFMRSFKQYFT